MSFFGRIFRHEGNAAVAEPPEEVKELYGGEDAPTTASEEVPAASVLTQDDQEHARQVMEEELARQRKDLEADRREEALRN